MVELGSASQNLDLIFSILGQNGKLRTVPSELFRRRTHCILRPFCLFLVYVLPTFMASKSSFIIHSFNKYFLSAYSILGLGI